MTRSFSELFAKNYNPLLKRCKLDLARWPSLPFSLIGRVNLIKMSLLPKFLYLFQHIPVFIKKSFFSNLDQFISSFLWSNKQARIGRTALRLPKSLGGVALPDFRYYYWACNINKFLFWNTGKAVPEGLIECVYFRVCGWVDGWVATPGPICSTAPTCVHRGGRCGGCQDIQISGAAAG